MTHKAKRTWMAVWAAEHAVALNLEGECGFCRECVGIIAGDGYPDYEWYDPDTGDRADKNGEVWRPEDAYHKHECVAVLGRGASAEEQLYEWLKWFDDNGFVVERGAITSVKPLHPIQLLMGKHMYARMVRK